MEDFSSAHFIAILFRHPLLFTLRKTSENCSKSSAWIPVILRCGELLAMLRERDNCKQQQVRQTWWCCEWWWRQLGKYCSSLDEALSIIGPILIRTLKFSMTWSWNCVTVREFTCIQNRLSISLESFRAFLSFYLWCNYMKHQPQRGIRYCSDFNWIRTSMELLAQYQSELLWTSDYLLMVTMKTFTTKLCLHQSWISRQKKNEA